jgi:NAD+-dependent secondary alcohol dehydrogenase Adh1
MRAALLTEYRRAFEIGTVADPGIVDPMDVIVEVCAAGFCRTDVHIWQGELEELHKSAGLEFPIVCGHENAGHVVEVGPGVTHVNIGDHVLLHPLATCGFCAACRSGHDMHCELTFFPGIAAPGGFAELVRTNARAIVPIPDGLTSVEVAPLSDAGLTAYHAVKKVLPLARPGTHVAVIGAGGVGHIGIQALRSLCQAEITVVDRNPAALEHARGWGADHVVLVRDDGSHVDEVRDISSGGAQAVLDFVGEGGMENQAVRMVGRNGIDMLVGYGGHLDLDVLTDVVTPEVTVAGSLVGSYTELVELLALTKRGAVTCSTVTFGLDGVNDAMAALEAGTIVGRGVLVP